MKLRNSQNVKPVFKDQIRRRYKIAIYLGGICWLLASGLMFFGNPNNSKRGETLVEFSYLVNMESEKNWVKVFTGNDFRASLLKAELEAAGINVMLRTDKDAGLHAGFGSSGFALVMVQEEDAEKVKQLVADFEEKMK